MVHHETHYAVKPGENKERRVDDHWKKGVNEAIRALTEGQTENKHAIELNTRVTTDGLHGLSVKIDDHRAETRPVVEALQSMQAGIKTIGTIGRFGKKALIAAAYCLAGWVFIKALASGDSLEAATTTFWKIVSGSK